MAERRAGAFAVAIALAAPPERLLATLRDLGAFRSPVGAGAKPAADRKP